MVSSYGLRAMRELAEERSRGWRTSREMLGLTDVGTMLHCHLLQEVNPSAGNRGEGMYSSDPMCSRTVAERAATAQASGAEPLLPPWENDRSWKLERMKRERRPEHRVSEESLAKAPDLDTPWSYEKGAAAAQETGYEWNASGRDYCSVAGTDQCMESVDLALADRERGDCHDWDADYFFEELEEVRGHESWLLLARARKRAEGSVAYHGASKGSGPSGELVRYEWRASGWMFEGSAEAVAWWNDETGHSTLKGCAEDTGVLWCVKC